MDQIYNEIGNSNFYDYAIDKRDKGQLFGFIATPIGTLLMT